MFEKTWPLQWCQFPIFKKSWWVLRVLSQLSPLDSSLPYLRAFQYFTVWPCHTGGNHHYLNQIDCEKWKIVIFLDILKDTKSAATTKPSWLIFTISESFPIWYCSAQYLNGLQKYDRSKLKVLLLLGEFRNSNFDLSYFWYPFRYRVIYYLI